ncbi:methyltransferase domain-containing protein [Guyparkeria halophila]|uniref:Methyltransferase domain-containing protein n=1 Tax=Guyparkeria halophila TaxID=47960 RepID=A0ABZ0YXH6_9GAMM|nr:methyltransferase domain-containing protein [Guyparkeria halophila]WQH15926.1 methyltransferase domain-containing protein [Guyparkeria halophila]
MSQNPASPARDSALPASVAAADWYRGPVGRLVADNLAELLAHRAQTAFGYHALVLGETGLEFERRFGWGRQLRIDHRVLAGPPGGRANGLLPVELDALPIESEAADLVIALHVLEDRRNPHEILREIDRSLRPEGRLMLVGVNPASLLHLRSRFWPGCHAPLAFGHHHPTWRVVDWLRVLGYRIDAIEPIGGVMPWCRENAYRRGERFRRLSAEWAWFLNGLYLIDATRRVVRPSRPKPAFRLASLVGQPVRGEVAGLRRHSSILQR